MTKTFIANCTQQRQMINVRLPDKQKPLSLTIEIGRQLDLGDLSPPSIDAFRDQLGPYGLVPVEEIKTTRKKITYVYSVGRPVTPDQMRTAIDRNKGILRDEGKKRREEAVIAANGNMNTEETPLNALDVSVEEYTSGDITDGEKIGEGYKIDNKANTSENKKPPRRTNKKG